MDEYDLIERNKIFEKVTGLYRYSKGDMHIAYRELLDYILDMPAADVQPVSQWISVKDRQPKCIRGSSDSVLVHRDNGECEVAYLVYDNDDGFYWYTQDERTGFEFEEVTHWMPLPEPPKDGDTNG